jgi:hypothetical protein
VGSALGCRGGGCGRGFRLAWSDRKVEQCPRYGDKVRAGDGGRVENRRIGALEPSAPAGRESGAVRERYVLGSVPEHCGGVKVRRRGRLPDADLIHADHALQMVIEVSVGEQSSDVVCIAVGEGHHRDSRFAQPAQRWRCVGMSGEAPERFDDAVLFGPGYVGRDAP